jgi:hypothetical protein
MDYLVGGLLALGVGLFATIVGFDRDRSFYPVVLAVIASYYGLFAIMGGALDILVVETVILAGFLAVSVAGFRSSLWLVVAALLGHGLLDLVHPHLIANPGAPAWWPRFCLAFDGAAAAYLAARQLGIGDAAVRP